MPEYSISLRRFINVVLENIEGDNSDEREEIIASLLILDPHRHSLDLDAPLNGETEERIFTAVVSNSQITCLRILNGVEFSAVEDMLRKAFMASPNLVRVDISISLTESETERIFSILRMSPTLLEIELCLGDCTESMAKPFAEYLRDESCSLQILALTWSTLGDDERKQVSQATVNTICEGIGDSRSLAYVGVIVPPVAGDADVVANSLAVAVSKSACLEKIGFALNYDTRNLADKVHNTLICTNEAKNFDLCFYVLEDTHFRNLMLSRNAPWKPLLSKNVPLALWPRILAKTNTWTQETSHTSLDALFYLVKEKCDVLLQNVRRRKIRKRKRFQFAL